MGFSKFFEISRSYPRETWRNPIFETPKLSKNSDNFAKKRDFPKKKRLLESEPLGKSKSEGIKKKKTLFPTQKGEFQKHLGMPLPVPQIKNQRWCC